MKTKVFNIWTDMVEEFIKTIPHDQQALSDWFDTQGAQLFEVGQREYFQAHREEYLKVTSPSEIKYTLASKQIIAGFYKIQSVFMNHTQFSETPALELRFTALMAEAVSDKYAPFIACRAVITAQSTKLDPINPIEKLKIVIESFQLLQQAATASIESMQAHLEKANAASTRGPTSPALYKEPVATMPNTATVNTNHLLKK